MDSPEDLGLDSTPPPPPKPTKYEPAVIRKLLNTAPNFSRMPGAEFVELLVDQLRFAVKEIDDTQPKFDGIQADLLRATRDLETANAECRRLRAELLERMKNPETAPVAKMPKPVVKPAAAPVKPPRRAAPVARLVASEPPAPVPEPIIPGAPPPLPFFQPEPPNTPTPRRPRKVIPATP